MEETPRKRPAIDTLKKYLRQCEDSKPDVESLKLGEINRFVTKKNIDSLKQTTLTRFFKQKSHSLYMRPFLGNLRHLGDQSISTFYRLVHVLVLERSDTYYAISSVYESIGDLN